MLREHVIRLESITEDILASSTQGHVGTSQAGDGEPYKRSRDGLQRQCEEQSRMISQLQERCKEINNLLQHRTKELAAVEEALFTVW